MIEFPCQFPIKVVYANQQGTTEEIISIIHHHYPEILEKDIKLRSSQQEHFVAITALIPANDQAGLDSLYHELTKLSYVKMVL
jgi:uncharacterized protein